MSQADAELNYRMSRPMHPGFALLRLALFGGALCMLGGSAPRWALFTYIFCFSSGLVGDFLFGLAPGMFAGGVLLGLSKWVAFAVMVWTAVRG